MELQKEYLTTVKQKKRTTKQEAAFVEKLPLKI